MEVELEEKVEMQHFLSRADRMLPYSILCLRVNDTKPIQKKDSDGQDARGRSRGRGREMEEMTDNECTLGLKSRLCWLGRRAKLEEQFGSTRLGEI